MSLLVAEDEPRVRSFIARGLREEGFEVAEACDGSAALQLLDGGRFDLMLLDWMLPVTSGLEVLRLLRSRGDVTPAVMVTAKDAVADRVLALNAGADDYLVKPFAFDELIARVRAVLRRAAAGPGAALSYADLTLDPMTHRVSRSGVDIRLTAREFALLQFLLEHAGEALSRSRIAEAIWEHDFETFSNVVDVYIRYLRAKIDEPFGRRLIQTIRGVGYSLRQGEPQ